MRKSTVSAMWLGGLAGIAAGILGILIGAFLVLAYGGTFGGVDGGEFTPTYDAFFWWMVGLITLGAFVVVAGGIAQVVAWIGALVNTFALPDKTWFVVLLVGGVVGIVGVVFAGFVVMVVYLLMAPDSTAPAGAGVRAVPPPATLAPVT